MLLSSTTLPRGLILQQQRTEHTYEDEHQNRSCLPLRLQSMDPPPKLHALDGRGSFFDCILLSTTNLSWVFMQRAFHAVAQSSMYL